MFQSHKKLHETESNADRKRKRHQPQCVLTPETHQDIQTRLALSLEMPPLLIIPIN